MMEEVEEDEEERVGKEGEVGESFRTAERASLTAWVVPPQPGMMRTS